MESSYFSIASLLCSCYASRMAKKRLQVDIDASLFDRLKKDADYRGLKFWAHVQQVLRDGLTKAKEEAAK